MCKTAADGEHERTLRMLFAYRRLQRYCRKMAHLRTFVRALRRGDRRLLEGAGHGLEALLVGRLHEVELACVREGEREPVLRSAVRLASEQLLLAQGAQHAGRHAPRRRALAVRLRH